MGVTTAWVISPHEDSEIEEIRPHLAGGLAELAADGELRRRWDRWRSQPLPDDPAQWWETPPWDARPDGPAESFCTLGQPTEIMIDASSPLEGDWWLLPLWHEQSRSVRLYYNIRTKDSGFLWFLHALGPERAAGFPGVLGNFLLDSAGVRQRLPQVEQALSFTAEERHRAEARDHTEYAGHEGSPEESCLFGPLRIFREAAEAGIGLCAVVTQIS